MFSSVDGVFYKPDHLYRTTQKARLSAVRKDKHRSDLGGAVWGWVGVVVVVVEGGGGGVDRDKGADEGRGGSKVFGKPL